jgi:hypothetical protein
MFLLCIFLLVGCSVSTVQNEKAEIAEAPLSISGQIISKKAGQSDFSLPFYPESIQTQGFRCISAIPDGRPGYISRADFESKKTVDEIAEFYRRKDNLFIKDINVEGSRRIIVSDNPSMTVYPGKGLKTGSTLVFYRNNQKACSELIFTGFALAAEKP